MTNLLQSSCIMLNEILSSIQIKEKEPKAQIKLPEE